MAVSPLRLLAQIITDSIDTIENRLADASTSFPSLDEPMDPTSKVESILVEPDMSRATSHIVAAAAQLMATVRQPVQTIMDDALAASAWQLNRYICHLRISPSEPVSSLLVYQSGY
ncbi:hypothetical protein D9757_012044 [Collybiopsis confluens]|uniref:Uncharacterized protein n=1 Tax=Collybiopsis confluens TaxID=2823264 RepID=A0A8H5LMZ8_9AGAR|nr:hypothetical protein D9757_012044 [Collybiopsis confluens]